jgi:hypothetical protein
LRQSKQYLQGNLPNGPFRPFHKSLIRTSINSIAGNYPFELVARAVEEGLWSPERALNVAAKVPDAYRAAQMYKAILNTSKLDSNDRSNTEKRGLKAALEISKERDLVQVLAALAPQLPGRVQAEVLERDLEAAWNVSNEIDRACAVLSFLDLMDSSAALRAIQDCLRSVQNCYRSDLLHLFCMLFPKASFETETLDLITQNIIEICYEWRWR